MKGERSLYLLLGLLGFSAALLTGVRTHETYRFTGSIWWTAVGEVFATVPPALLGLCAARVQDINPRRRYVVTASILEGFLLSFLALGLANGASPKVILVGVTAVSWINGFRVPLLEGLLGEVTRGDAIARQRSVYRKLMVEEIGGAAGAALLFFLAGMFVGNSWLFFLALVGAAVIAFTVSGHTELEIDSHGPLVPAGDSGLKKKSCPAVRVRWKKILTTPSLQISLACGFAAICLLRTSYLLPGLITEQVGRNADIGSILFRWRAAGQICSLVTVIVLGFRSKGLHLRRPITMMLMAAAGHSAINAWLVLSPFWAGVVIVGLSGGAAALVRATNAAAVRKQEGDQWNQMFRTISTAGMSVVSLLFMASGTLAEKWGTGSVIFGQAAIMIFVILLLRFYGIKRKRAEALAKAA